MPSTQLPDGRWEHVFSASWLKTFSTCAEQARRKYFRLFDDPPSDYTALGSAVHAGIETTIRAKLNDDPFELFDARETALDKLAAIEAEPGYTNKKWSHDDLVQLVNQHLDTFESEVYPVLQPVAVEQEFNRVLYEDCFRTIRLRGFIDYVDAGLGVIDWKTAGSPHKTWETGRYATQPTVYAWAWAQETGTPISGMRYVVFVHNKPPQTYWVERQQPHVDWLVAKCVAAARQVESGLSVWTPNDSGWWCSPKWCGAFKGCKGSTGLTE